MPEAFRAFLFLALFWLIQPVFMWYFVIGQPACSKNLLGFALFLLGSFVLSDNLRRVREPVADDALLWVYYALLGMRYIHASFVGGVAFANHFGIQTFRQTALFTLSVPTILFTEGKQQVKGGNSTSDTFRRTVTSILNIGGMVTLAHIVLQLKLYELPIWAQRVLEAYMLALTGGVSTLIHEIPVRLLVQNQPGVVVIPLVDNPILSKSPRDIWRRWTVCAGYHFRKGLYEPLIQKGHGRFIALSAVFLANTLLHWICWSYWTQRCFRVEWFLVLVLFPLVSISLQDALRILLERGSWAYTIASYILFIVSVCVVLPIFYDVNGMPSTLHQLALAYSGGESV